MAKPKDVPGIYNTCVQAGRLPQLTQYLNQELGHSMGLGSPKAPVCSNVLEAIYYGEIGKLNKNHLALLTEAIIIIMYPTTSYPR